MIKRGRPPLKPGDRKVYQRIAVYKSTYERLSKKSKKTDTNIVDIIDELV